MKHNQPSNHLQANANQATTKSPAVDVGELSFMAEKQLALSSTCTQLQRQRHRHHHHHGRSSQRNLDFQ